MSSLVLILAGVALGVAGVIAPDNATARDLIAGVLLIGAGVERVHLAVIRRRYSDRRAGYVHRR